MGPTGTVAGNTPAPNPAGQLAAAGAREYTDEDVRQLVTALEEPFEPREIKWRVTNTSSDRRRGQVIAYADPRAYTDRLNELVTVRGWTRRYAVQTINNVERKLKDTTQVAGKIVVTSEVSIDGLGTHSGMGEEWADNENAATAAEAQAFKRACTCFGLGRYLYDLGGIWVDLDEHRQPKSTPKLPDWAMPKRKPANGSGSRVANRPPANNTGNHPDATALRGRVETVAEQVGYSLSRSGLMGIAKVDTAERVPPAFLAAVAAKLDDTLRGVERLRAATAIVGQQRYSELCRELNFASDSLDDIPDREALRKLIELLEKESRAAGVRHNGASTPAANIGPVNGSGGASATPGRELGEARSALIKEAQRVARLKQMTVAAVVDRAAKGAFTFAGLQGLTAGSLPAIKAAIEVLQRVK